MTTVSTERELFEAWAVTESFNIDRHYDDAGGEYHRVTTRWAWMAWQAARSADTSGARWSADALYDAIMVVLEHHRLSYSVTADDETLPLIDALCSGQPLDVGRDEIVLICDAIYNEVLMPEPPPAAPGGPAGARRPDENSPSGPSDRALNPQPEAVDHDRGAP